MVMVNNQAIKRLEDWTQSVWNHKELIPQSFKTNIEVYKFLKEEFRKGDVRTNDVFKWAFSAFYGMSRVPVERHSVFFDKMETLRDNHAQADARQITVELQPALGKNYFSFVTKMLNIVDDATFPIYDSQVSVVFARCLPAEGIDHKSAIHTDITDTYAELASRCIINEFRERYNCPDVGHMKILDTIFWSIGKQWDEEK